MTSSPTLRLANEIKCLIWDLDNTLWRGVLAEGDPLVLMPRAPEVIQALDARGILQSIASKNDFEPAIERLRDFGLSDYFLYPQINWGPKSVSIRRIAEQLNIATDSLAFVDDQPYERDEVQCALGNVMCIGADRMDDLLELPALSPRFVTEESRNRRSLYLCAARRAVEERSFEGPKEEFLASLGMTFRIARARAGDLQRLEELLARTHQLNTTGYVYSYEELEQLRSSPQHELLVAALEDRYGTYGTIGCVLLEKHSNHWIMKTFLMSCRVISRGVGMVMINYVKNRARAAGVELRAEIIRGERNRMMYATYRFAGFTVMHTHGAFELLRASLAEACEYPHYVQVSAEGVPG